MFYPVRLFGRTIHLINQKLTFGYVMLQIATAIIGLSIILDFSQGALLGDLKINIASYAVFLACLVAVISSEMATISQHRVSDRQIKESPALSTFGIVCSVANLAILVMIAAQMAL